MNRICVGANCVRPNWTRRISRAVFMAFAALSLSLAVGCGGDDDDDDGGDNNSGNKGEGGGDCGIYTCGWPSESQLAERYLDGLTLPTGATKPMYHIDLYYKWVDAIGFDCTAETDEAVITWFDNNEAWAQYEPITGYGYCIDNTDSSSDPSIKCNWKHSERSTWLTYDHDYNSGTCAISI